MKKLDLVLAWALVLVGFVHLSGAFVRLVNLNIGQVFFFADSVAFFGSIALMEAGFLNVVRNTSGRGIGQVASIICNSLLLLSLVLVSISLIRHGEFFSSYRIMLTLVLVGAEAFFSFS